MSQSPCEKIQELVLWALDETPPAPEQRLLESHLAECPACRAYQLSMRQLTGSLRALETVSPPADLADRIMTRLQPAARRPQNGGLPTLRRYAPVAAAVLLLALAVPFALQSLPGPSGQPAGEVAAVKPRPSLASEPSAEPVNPVEQTGKPPVEKTTAPVTVAVQPQPTHPAPGLKEPSPVTVTPTPAATVQVDADTAYNQVELAMANVTEDLDHQNEDDIYYDPTSELVGF